MATRTRKPAAKQGRFAELLNEVETPDPYQLEDFTPPLVVKPMTGTATLRFWEIVAEDEGNINYGGRPELVRLILGDSLERVEEEILGKYPIEVFDAFIGDVLKHFFPGYGRVTETSDDQ